MKPQTKTLSVTQVSDLRALMTQLVVVDSHREGLEAALGSWDAVAIHIRTQSLLRHVEEALIKDGWQTLVDEHREFRKRVLEP